MKRKRYSAEQIVAHPNMHWFSSLTDAKVKIAAWLKDCNESRPHRALNNLAPLSYLGQLENGV